MSNILEEGSIDLENLTSENEDSQISLRVGQLITYPADYTLEVLNQKWLNSEIQVPPFQRDFVWSLTQSSKLIESFLIGLPVPAVYLYTERDSQKYLIIDGQQRLKSIFYFFSGYFGAQENNRRLPFRLKGLSHDSEFSGKAFDTLHESEQGWLKNSTLRTFTVKQLEPDDDRSMYQIFERLNTGGTSLTSQEIRDCVYYGELAKALRDINLLENWRKILGKPGLDSRKRDVELILRFLAMQNIDEYRKPMKLFLNNYMKQNQNIESEELKKLEHVFEATCNMVIAQLGENPFHVRAGLNVAVFDAVMVAFSNNLGSIPDDVQARYNELVHDEQFVQCTSSNTTDDGIVRRRFRLASERLFGN